MGHEQDAQRTTEWTEHYKWLLGGACLVILYVAGGAIGVYSHGVEAALLELKHDSHTQNAAIWRILNDRAGLPQQVHELEAKLSDHEQRLRDLDRRKH